MGCGSDVLSVMLLVQGASRTVGEPLPLLQVVQNSSSLARQQHTCWRPQRGAMNAALSPLGPSSQLVGLAFLWQQASLVHVVVLCMLTWLQNGHS